MLKYCLLALVVLSSCRPETEDLSGAELQRVDTLYANAVELLRPQLDSICEFQSDSLVVVAVDSLLKVRQEEMEQILNR